MINQQNHSFMLKYGHRDHLPPAESLESWDLMNFAGRHDLKEHEIDYIKSHRNGNVVQSLLSNSSVGYHHISEVLGNRPYDYGSLMYTHPDHLVKAADDKVVLEKYDPSSIVHTAGMSKHFNKNHIRAFFDKRATKDHIVNFSASNSLGLTKRFLKNDSDLRYEFARHKLSKEEHPYRFLDGDFSPHQIDGILGMTKDNLHFIELKDQGIDHLIKTDRINHIGDANRITNPDHIKAIIDSRHMNQIEDLRDYHKDEAVRISARERLSKK